jgi:hypothetical protein
MIEGIRLIEEVVVVRRDVRFGRVRFRKLREKIVLLAINLFSAPLLPSAVPAGCATWGTYACKDTPSLYKDLLRLSLRIRTCKWICDSCRSETVR